MDSKVGVRHSHNHNPFLNHLIIEKIISFSNRLQDLKSLRLISSQWNAQTAPKLFKSSIVTFKCQTDMEAYAKLFDLSVPHWNFHWKATGIDLSDKLMRQVLVSAEELHISKGLITLDDLKEIIKSGAKLKTLSFNEVFIQREEPVEGEIEHEQNRSQIEPHSDFNCISENLTRLEVTTCDKHDNFPWKLVFPSLVNLRILHAQLQSTSQVTRLLESLLLHPIKLEELSCFLVDMREEHLWLLASLEMPLKFLDISLASSVPFRAVEGLLSSTICTSLETLKIFKEADCGHKNYFTLPKLPKLKVLELLGDPVAKIFTNVNLSCPNLASLNLSEVSCRDVMAHPNQASHLNLKSLCIEECFFPTNVLSKLAHTFPNLTKLCLFLNDENVGTVFQSFEKLEELTILGTEISDDGITGGRDQGQEHDRPFIGDCKSLRMLNLYPQPLPGVTDACIYHGLLLVTELTSLSAPETAITDKGLRALQRAKPNLVKLYAKIVIDLTSQESFLRSPKYQIL